jgi:hypothetical protein
MTEETLIEETIETETQEEQVGTPEKKTKSFTEEQVNQIVKDRLAKEKRTFSAKQSEYESEKISLQETIDAYEKKFGALIADQLKDIPEPYKKLLDKMTLLEKMEFLSENSGDLNGEKKTIPTTPKNGKDNNNSFKPSKVNY